MECSSMFFPIQVKEELLDDGYDTSQTSMSGYYSPTAHYPPQGQQQLSGQHPGIKTEPGDPRDSPGAINHRMVHHHQQHHPSQQHQHHRGDNDMSGNTLAQLGGPPPHHTTNHGSPYMTQHDPSMQSPGGHMGHHHQPQHHQHHQHHQQQQQEQQPSMPCSTSPKPKKKKKKKPSSRDMEMQGVPSPMSNNNNSDDMSKKIKQEKITDTFKVRKKVDRFNGMPEEEVVKRTLPDHLATELDIVIIGINPGLFAAFKGHHYAGPGNHFWKCLYLSGLIPNPMTADDDFRLIEFGIGFTNIVSRTTRGSADLARKEIREGAQILQEKIQKYKPKIAVFNGKGIYEVFSGKKNFDFGKQPEPMEGTNTVVYVMPSSSARCAQLPRAVDKVPFYVALKKLRDHLCGRLPVLRDSEVCFPDVKLKIESRDGAVKTEPVDQDHDEEEETRMRLDGGSGEAAAAYGSLQGQLMHSQRNFHQHPLGRAALAAAAAAGGYMEISLARAGMTSNGGRPTDGSHKSAGGDPSKKKASKKKRRSEDGGEDDGDGRSDLLKRVKTENPYGEPSSNCSSPGRPSSVDYHTSGHPRPPSHGPPPPAAHSSSSLQRPSYNGAGGYPMSPPAGEHSSPLYSAYHHQAHVKSEKGVDGHPLHGHHMDANGGRSPTLLGSYAASVGCLYNPTGYGQPAPPPYFGTTPPPNPYGTYHHLSAHLPINHHALNHHHHHHSHHHRSGGSNLNALASQSAAAELFATAAVAGLRENGLHHPTARHHLQQQMQQQQQQHEYYGGVHAQGGPVGGPPSAGGGGPPPPYPSPLPPASSSHKDSSPTGGSAGGGGGGAAFHQYPSPPTTAASSSSSSASASYHPHLHHLQSPNAGVGAAAASHNQYCSPPPPSSDGGGGGPTSSPNASSSSNANNGLTSMYDHQSAPPLYANLDSIKVKQERDSTYGEY